MGEKPPSWLVDELARRLWEAFRGKPVTLDKFYRPNYFVTRAFAAQLLSIAQRYGIADPLAEIDWEAIIDPELTREENIELFEKWLRRYRKEYVPPPEGIARAISEMERYIHLLREELERAPPEERESIEQAIRDAEEKLEELRRIERPERRREKPRPPAPPAPPRPPERPSIPLGELRARVEHHIRRIPRVYRVDWLREEPYVARISVHREAFDSVAAMIREWGGEIRREIPTRPPMRVIEADFSRASPPPVAPPPELERYVLWSKFSAILTSYGINPEDHREEFEEVVRTCSERGMAFEECQRRVEDLARTLRPPAPPPMIPVGVLEELRSLRRELEQIRRAVAWRPSTPEEVRAVFEALYLVPPRTAIRVDEAGHPYIGPSDETLVVLKQFLPPLLIKWFTSCPVCRVRYPGGYMTPAELAEDLIDKGLVPAQLVEWFRRYARMVEEAERRGI